MPDIATSSPTTRIDFAIKYAHNGRTEAIHTETAERFISQGSLRGRVGILLRRESGIGFAGEWRAVDGGSLELQPTMPDDAHRDQLIDLILETREHAMSVTEAADEELHAAAAGIVVRAADGTIAARHPEGVGVVLGDERPFDWSLLRAPAIVLVEPEAVSADV